MLVSAFFAALACCLTADGANAVSATDAKPIEAQIAADAPDAQFEVFLDRLMMAESGGQDLAANPRSTALGSFQFIKATFLDLVRRHFTEETETLDEDQVLDLRVNRAFARRAAVLYCKENLAFMSGEGLSPTFGHLRLSFLVGPAAAVRLIQALPDTPASDLLGAAVIKANPFMRGMSAADLILRSARDISDDRKSLVVRAPPPRQRPLGLRPRVRELHRTPAAARPAKRAIAATCNRKLASCRRWIALREAAQRRHDRKPGGVAGKKADKPGA
jgi:hypothetical protein